MESGLLFSTLVLTVGALNLIDRIIHFLTTRVMVQDRDASTKTTRDDWYMFFNRSDLTGKGKTEPVKPNRMDRQSQDKVVARRRAGRVRAAL